MELPRETIPTTTNGEQSLGSVFERLVTASQGTITKRIDLAILEGQEVLTRGAKASFVGALAVLLASMAWAALIAAVVLALTPESTPAVHLALFGATNAVAVVLLAGFVLTLVRPPVPAVGSGTVTGNSSNK